jgi:Macrocin-O-methyltransferase (TylF)
MAHNRRVRSQAKRLILNLAQRSQSLRRAAAVIVRDTYNPEHKDTYGYLKQKFIENGGVSPFDRQIRAEIVTRFEAIDREVPISTTPTDGLFLAELLLNVEADGDVVECGCYAGGSSAKLSIIANLRDRQLYIFDSFAGLPIADQQFLTDNHCRRSNKWVTEWTDGRYAAELRDVYGVIERWGEISACHFVKGWFKETVNADNLPTWVALAFADVDLASSARECFLPLWPRLANKGVYVTHDTAYIRVLQELYKPEVWRNAFDAIPPILFGAGFGLCDASPHIGYMVKGDSLTAEYLKGLTIDK